MKTVYTKVEELKIGTYVYQDNDDGTDKYKTYYKVLLKKNNSLILEYVGSNKKGLVDMGGFMIIDDRRDLGYAMLSPVTKKEVLIDVL